MVFVGSYSITQIVCILAQCTPFASIFNPKIPGSCININDVYIVVSSFNIFTDLIILLLPMPLLWGLNTTMSRKIQLSFIFGLGAL